MSYSSRYLRITDPLMRGPDVLFVQQRLQNQQLIKVQDIVIGTTRP